MIRNVNNETVAGIIKSEGLRLKAYLCPAKVWTIGIGHTGPDVKPGMEITKAKAYELLDKDLDMFEKFVSENIYHQMSDNEYGAMVSLAFNIGTGSKTDSKRRGFYWSSVRERFNNGDFKGAADAFLFYNKARVDGKLQVLKGLDIRRNWERSLFLTPDHKKEELIELQKMLIELKDVELVPSGMHKLFPEMEPVFSVTKPLIKI